jgi:hypothetical protein
MKHHIRQMQPDLMILKALKREMKTRVFPNNDNGKKAAFSSLILVPFKSCNKASSDLYDASHH